MSSAVEVFFNKFSSKSEELVILTTSPTSSFDYSFSSEVSGLNKFESYFDSNIHFFLKNSEPMHLVSKIQLAKKNLIKTENWTATDISDRLIRIRKLVFEHQSNIAFYEAHFQGTTRAFQIRWSIEPLLKLLDQMILQSEKSNQSLSKGLIGAVTAKSQSFFEIGWRIAYALFHRDSLVIKPASSSSLSGVIWSEILKDCDLPEGIVSFVYGNGQSVGRFLMDHPGVKNISYSGGYETLKGYIPSLEKKYQFYFNGKNAVCVLPDADVQKNLKDIVSLFVEHNGKGVYSPSRLFVIDTFEKEFKIQLEQTLKSIPDLKSIDGEFGFLPLKESEKKKLQELKIKFENEGAKIIFSNDNFMFYSELPNCSELHQENLELPIYNLTSVKYSHEMARWLNNCSFGHSLVIFGSEEKAKKLFQKSEVGKVILNPSPLHFQLLSPVKLSGFGDTGFDLPNSFYSFLKIG